MLRILILLTLWLCAGACVAQSVQKQQQIANRMWSTDNPDFTQTQVNEKWKNYSAVVLAKSIELEELHAHGPYVHENLYVHQRIKLNDKAAVNQYSEITFNDDELFTQPTNAMVWSTDLFIGLKVVKPGGAENIIPLTDAVVMEIKSGFKRRDYKKLAVPDLEPGDILDYYVVQLSNTQIHSNAEVSLMTPYFFTLSNEKPIQKQTVKISLSPIFGFSHKSLNGAPQMMHDKCLAPYSRMYLLQDTDREPVPQMRWLYNYRVLPLVKFQASYNQQPDADGIPALCGRPGTNRTSFTEQDYTRYLKNFRGKPTKATKYVGSHLETHMRFFFPNEARPEVLTREAFYFVRQFMFVESQSWLMMHNMDSGNSLSNWEFTSIMSAFLKKKKIKHDVLLTTRSYVTGLADAVMPEELELLIRLNTATPVYIASPERYSLYGEIPYYFLGNQALAMNGLANTKEATVVPFTIPGSSHLENTELTDVKLSFAPDNHFKTTLSRRLTYTGLNRHNIMGLVVTSSDYISQCRRNKFWTGVSEGTRKSIGAHQKEMDEKLKQLSVEDIEAREKALTKYIEEVLAAKVISVDSAKMIQVGTWHDQREMKYRDSFTLEGLVTQAGPNLILNAGLLSGYQTELKKQDLNRGFPWFISHPATYTYTISVNLPQGYNLKGLESLNYNVTNKVGGFISKATLDGSTLSITTSEYFYSHTGTANEWPLMVEVLKAAYEFSQQKLLLQKQNLSSN